MLSCIGQTEAGHQVSLAYGPIYGPEGSMLPEVESHRNINAVEVKSLIRAVNPLRDWQCLRELQRLIRQLRPDVVHTHSSKAGILGRTAAWRERVPCVVHTIHGLPFHRFGSPLNNALYIAAERFAAHRCHAIVSVADAMTSQARAAGIGSAQQYTTIRSGIRIEPFLESGGARSATRTKLGFTDECVVLGTVSRLAELKGHDDLLDAFAQRLRTDPRLRMLWVGDGWWRERLMQRAAALGLHDRIVTTGLVSPDEIPSLLTAIDVLVHPSYREGLPRAVVQAFLAGKPAVAYDIDGAREVCIDGRTGRLVPVGDTAALAAAIAELAADSESRAALGSAGRELCRSEFSAQTMNAKLLTLYQAILGRAGRARAAV